MKAHTLILKVTMRSADPDTVARFHDVIDGDCEGASTAISIARDMAKTALDDDVTIEVTLEEEA